MRWSFILLLCISLPSCYNTTSTKAIHEGQKMPSFNLLLMDSITRLNVNTIPNGQPIVLLLVMPDCPFCKKLTQEITSNIRSLSNIKFYVLSPYPFNEIKNYYDHYKLKQYPNITVGQDSGSFFIKHFKVTSVPSMAIYTKDKRLKKVLTGDVNSDLIKSVTLE